ncbi:hypothetical protein A2U01_0116982, partial [Trifolium medium]|nr:hypothetical protein [Trifolium medium]
AIIGQMSIHIEFKEIPGKGTPTLVVTVNKRKRRRRSDAIYSDVVVVIR